MHLIQKQLNKAQQSNSAASFKNPTRPFNQQPNQINQQRSPNNYRQANSRPNTNFNNSQPQTHYQNTMRRPLANEFNNPSFPINRGNYQGNNYNPQYRQPRQRVSPNYQQQQNQGQTQSQDRFVKNQRSQLPAPHFFNRFQQNQMKSIQQTERDFPKPPGRGRYIPKEQQQFQQPNRFEKRRQYDDQPQLANRRGRFQGGQNRNLVQSNNRTERVNYRGVRARNRGRDRNTNYRDQQRSRQFQQKVKQSKYKSKQKDQKEKDSFVDDEQQNESDQMEQESSKQYQSKSQSYDENSKEDDESAQQQSEQYQQSQSQENRINHKVIVQKPKTSQLNVPVDPKKSDQMCPYEQFKDRNTTFINNNRDPKNNKLKLDTSRSFSIFQIDKSTMNPNYNQALKRFRRSADRDDEDDQNFSTRDAGRSIKGLQLTINYIIKYVVDADNMDPRILPFPLPPNQPSFQFMHIYDFLWDRMRQMIKDITRLPQQLRLFRPIVEICEQIARFFIIAINEGRKKYQSKLEFDEKMNRQSLTKILTPLMGIYNVSRFKLKSLIYNLKQTQDNITVQMVKKKVQQTGFYISPHQPELTAYALIISNDIKKSLNEKIYDGFQDLAFNPLFSSQEVQMSLQLQKAQANNNYEKYFSILQDQTTDYVASCLILHNLQDTRCKAAKVFRKTHKFAENCSRQFKDKQLKELLRFKKGQQEVFQRFLQFLDVEAGLSELDLHGIYSCPQFIFQKDKLSRDGYTNKPASGRVMNTQILSRSELVTRSWKNSNYDDILIKCFLNISIDKIEQEAQQTKINKKNSAKTIQISGKQTKSSQQKAQKINQFMQMRNKINQEKKRQKFLETVGKSIIHIMDVCLGKQGAWKKGVNKIYSVIEIMLQRKKRTAMEAFYSYFFMKEKLKFYFVNLLEYTKQAKIYNQQKEQNFTGINCCIPIPKRQPMRIARQFKRQDDIEQLNKTTTFIAKMYEQIWRTCPNNQENSDNSSVKILIIISDHINDYKLKIIQNLHNFLSGKASRQLTSFLNSSIQLANIHQQRYCLHYTTNQNKIKILEYELNFQKVETTSFSPYNFNVHLYDSIIVLQFEESMQKVLKNLNENYMLYYPKQNNSTNVQLIKKLDKKLKKPIKYIHFVNENRRSRIITEQKMQETYRNLNIVCEYYFLHMQTKGLNTLLKMEMRKFLLSTIRECNSVPESCCMKLSDLLLEIKQTAKFIKNSFITQAVKQTMAHYQVYINYCFSQIRKYQSLVFSSFELLRNWDTINQQFFALINTGTTAKITGYTGYRYFLDELLCKLQMAFVQEIKDHRHEHNKKYLQYMIRDYLNNFDFNSQMKDQMLITMMQNVTLKNGNIEGETIQIMEWILLKLSKYLSYVFVIMPKGYKFYMDKQYFLKTTNRLINKNNNEKQIIEHKKKQVQQHGLQKKPTKLLKPWERVLVLQVQAQKDVKRKLQKGKRSVQQLYEQMTQENNFTYKYAYMLDQLRKRRKVSV